MSARDEGGAAPRELRATVDQVDEDVVVLDVEGHRVRVPREFLPEPVREGAGYRVTFASAPETSAELAQSVQARLRALMGGGGSSGGGGTGGGGSEGGGSSGGDEGAGGRGSGGGSTAG